MLCVWAMRSMNHAVAARRYLLSAGISSQVVSLDGGVTKKGCAYGVSFRRSELDRARGIMVAHGLDYGEIIGGGK